MPAPLAASFEELCKETPVEEFVLRFSEQWKCIRRSVGKYIYIFYFEFSSLSKDPNFSFRNFFRYFQSKQTQTGLDSYAGHTKKCIRYKLADK